jgi:hypothetical protein
MMAEALVSRLDLDARAEATPWARHHVRDVLSAWQVADAQIDATELAVCELTATRTTLVSWRWEAAGSPGRQAGT